jgi:hypothetical protein
MLTRANSACRRIDSQKLRPVAVMRRAGINKRGERPRRQTAFEAWFWGGWTSRRRANAKLVPLAGIEPALLAELDFESSASTSSATGAFALSRGRAWRSGRTIAGARAWSTRTDVIVPYLDRFGWQG